MPKARPMDEVKAVLADYKAGMPVLDVLKKHKVSSQSLYKWIARDKAPPRRPPLIDHLISSIPPSGTAWPKAERDRWLAALKSVFDLLFTE